MEAKKPNHRCKVCNAAYYACNGCHEVKHLHPYLVICCSEEHYAIYNILRMHKIELMTVEEARQALTGEGVTLKNAECFIPAVYRQITAILDKPAQAKKKNFKKTTKTEPCSHDVTAAPEEEGSSSEDTSLPFDA